MSRHFNNSDTLLEDGDYHDGLTELIVVQHVRFANITLGNSFNTDIQGITSKSRRPMAYYNMAHAAWDLTYDRRNNDAWGNSLHLTVVNAAGTAISTAYIKLFSTLISADTWYVVVAAWDGTDQTIWLSTGDSGDQAAPVADMQHVSGIDDVFRVGGGRSDSYRTPVQVFDGDIAEVAVYTGGGFPTQGEVDAWLSGFAPPLVRTRGLASYWPLIGHTSPEIDLYGSRSLTLVNSPAQADHSPVILPTSPILVTAAVAAQSPVPIIMQTHAAA